MNPRLLYLIVFIEGFCSLGAEVIALRRLTPHVGSSIVVTAPTIAFFLLALALGYAAGSRITTDFLPKVARNFLFSAVLAGIGLSAGCIDLLFSQFPAGLAYLIFVGGVLCPLAWWLGQTVPILSNLFKHSHTGEASGTALYWSTLGSFLGSLTLSLLVMQWLGVGAAIILCTAGLVLGALLLMPQRKHALACTATVLLSIAANAPQLNPDITADTAYAEYIVAPVDLPGFQHGRAFLVNKSTASLLDDSDPPRYTRYIEHLRRILLDDLHFKDRQILVLGAGGFTLAHREPLNQYTFVDIDPAIRPLAEKHFLREPARGTFVVDDARHFVRNTEQRFDALLVDVFSAHTSIPSHLVTREFWAETRRPLQPDGLMFANLILDGHLATPYARNLLTTIESVYGRCSIDVLHKTRPLSNVVVTCFASSQPQAAQRYRDEQNRADTDLAASR